MKEKKINVQLIKKNHMMKNDLKSLIFTHCLNKQKKMYKT